MDNTIKESKSQDIQNVRLLGKGEIMYPYRTVDYPIKAAGRPMKYKTLASLKARINKYFDACDEKHMPYTMSGFALFLGVSRQTLLKYELESEEFEYIIEQAKTKIEEYAEKRLFWGNCAGAIFSLKNNFPGWMEKQETKVTGPLGSILDQIHAQSKKLIGNKKQTENK